jgi:putative Ca2+/H+ antiporter (TMEM165/GDT1 family)
MAPIFIRAGWTSTLLACARPGGLFSVEALLVSTLVVAIAEIGDKTQLLAIILATRFKKPVPIILGILVATLANHALAATAGYWVSDFLSGAWFKWAIAISFIAMAAWALIPDKADDEEGASAGRYGVFVTTAIAFFLVEMGDKTQIATVALGAKFHSIFWVAAGTTLGMMLANVPAVYLGEAATKVVPLKYVRMGAALIFLLLGLWQVAELTGVLK